MASWLRRLPAPCNVAQTVAARPLLPSRTDLIYLGSRLWRSTQSSQQTTARSPMTATRSYHTSLQNTLGCTTFVGCSAWACQRKRPSCANSIVAQRLPWGLWYVDRLLPLPPPALVLIYIILFRRPTHWQHIERARLLNMAFTLDPLRLCLPQSRRQRFWDCSPDRKMYHRYGQSTRQHRVSWVRWKSTRIPSEKVP
jgi:hypothetical protein